MCIGDVWVCMNPLKIVGQSLIVHDNQIMNQSVLSINNVIIEYLQINYNKRKIEHRDFIRLEICSHIYQSAKKR